MKIHLAEMFVGFQGEGPNLGRPSLFVRTHGCNLQCSWCDSKFAWAGGANDKYEVFDSPEHLAEVYTHSSFDHPQAVVLTGGEPLLWQKPLYEAMMLYRKINPVPIEVETSGTVMPSDDMLRLCSFNISHKLSSANAGPREKLWREDVVRKIAWAGSLRLNNVCFKPVFAPTDYGEVEEYLQWLTGVCEKLGIAWELLRQHIYFMPEATSPAALAVTQGLILELAQNYGVRATTRLQIISYGNQRGR